MAEQSRRASLIETLTQTGAGFLVSIGLTCWLFPAIDGLQAAKVTAIFTAASILRQYALRRTFNRLRPNPNQPDADHPPLAYATFHPQDGARLCIKLNGVFTRSAPLTRSQALSIIETLLPKLR